MVEFLSDAHIWLVFSFALFVFILWSKGKNAVVGALDGRIAAIREEIRQAENLRIEAQELLAQYQRKHRDAVNEAQKIVSEAESHAAKILEDAHRELNETMARREKNLLERVELMERDAVESLQRYAADLTIQAAAGIIAERMDDAFAKTLADNSVTEVKRNTARGAH